MKLPSLATSIIVSAFLGFGAQRACGQALDDPIAVPVHINALAPFDSGSTSYYFHLTLAGENSSPTASDGYVEMEEAGQGLYYGGFGNGP